MSERSECASQMYKRLKIVVLGDRSVGKSSLIHRFISDQFTDQTKSTVGVDFTFKKVKYNEVNYKIEMWDTAGQEKYRSLVKSYLKGAQACIFVYDYKDPVSYRNLVEWVQTFDSVSTNDAFKIIVGNKQDLDLKESDGEKKKLAIKKESPELCDVKEMPASAKTGFNIDQIFEEIIQNVEIKRPGKTEKALQLQSIKTIKNLLNENKNCGC